MHWETWIQSNPEKWFQDETTEDVINKQTMHLVTVMLNWTEFAEREKKTIKAPYGTHGCYF